MALTSYTSIRSSGARSIRRNGACCFSFFGARLRAFFAGGLAGFSYGSMLPGRGRRRAVFGSPERSVTGDLRFESAMMMFGSSKSPGPVFWI